MKKIYCDQMLRRLTQCHQSMYTCVSVFSSVFANKALQYFVFFVSYLEAAVASVGCQLFLRNSAMWLRLQLPIIPIVLTL